MWMIETAIALGIALALIALYLFSCIRVLNEYERGVIFRLGRAMPKPKGPGLIMVFRPVDSMMRVDLRTITKVIEPQDIITRDNVSVRVNAVLYFRVVDPMRSVLECATSRLWRTWPRIRIPPLSSHCRSNCWGRS